ncbi:ras-related protein Rab-9B-like [Limulus polyphemus]|uniref:Ras-related protein Rab-9B-like n=1 Tax=Limulus polyphemus TaxID=6850 RepID=A0ABM1C0H0_LIMPO|nr:ras-related protein Rab-9B-like [Limulus polyphemus]XP_013791945.1 ras-related protein Rab-9B-like [Limulus polyphemus]XP_013792016.1 ras-related protein Rab-9B-like [Limulus polyphemus]XP_013792087.1 ras-related protein Rab-9B-like [Limulus polyphemus]XP_022236549.1 ras-related protein Rab-9B-like [Limulus polyphemus]
MADSKETRGGRGLQKSHLLKVVLLGDGGVGKSCLMNRFVNNQFDSESYHTIGVEFLNKDITVKGEVYTLQIWDTAGQERFRSLRTPFYRGSDICILTYGVDDRKSFENLNVWKKEFVYYADVKDPTTFPFVVVGNKVDIPPNEQQITTEEAQLWCNKNGNYSFVETSAKDATNVEKAFHMAVGNWVKMEESMEKPDMGNTLDLRKHQNKKSCCVTL